jgi:thiamine-phosphate pyrophosphorylase
MSDSLRRRKLARAAAHLAARHGLAVPPLALMTDDDRLPDPLAAARALPRGSLVVVRTRNNEKRRALTLEMTALARRHGLVVIVADDEGLASSADGLHLPEARLGEAAHWRACHPGPLLTASVHSLAALRRAAKVDAVFLSPVFPTRSHPGRAALTAVRANLIARLARVPVYALGGVDAGNAGLLSAAFAGIAAIGALESDVQA